MSEKIKGMGTYDNQKPNKKENNNNKNKNKKPEKPQNIYFIIEK